MRWTLATLLLIVIVGCGSSRKQLERAGLYEKEGMFSEAYSAYEVLHARKPKQTEAHIGMKRTAQRILDQRMMDASARYRANDLQSGEQARNQALAYKGEMDGKGLALQWDTNVDDQRRTARTAKAALLLHQADEAFRADRFSEAEELAGACTKLDPDQKQAEYLELISQLEPRYRQGRKAEDLGLWREAHGAYRWITDRDVEYKDAWQRLATSKEKAAYTLAYIPLLSQALYTNQIGTGPGLVEEQLSADLQQAILDLRDPLIILVDRTNTEALLSEQQRNMNGTYDDRYVVEAGKLIGARYVMTGKILRFDDVLSKQMEVQMQVIDTQSGRILLADVVRVNKQEIARGAPRAQLLDRAAKRMALRLAELDPGAN